MFRCKNVNENNTVLDINVIKPKAVMISPRPFDLLLVLICLLFILEPSALISIRKR